MDPGKKLAAGGVDLNKIKACSKRSITESSSRWYYKSFKW